MGQMTLITGAERRRRWSSEERAQILAAIEAPGAVVAEVARRADVCTSLVYKWRREARSAASASGFARVIVEDTRPSPAREPELGAITVELSGARIRIGANAPAALISATLKALDLDSRSLRRSGSGSRPAPTDMRRGMKGLALQVQEALKRDPHGGDLYVFRGARGDLIKILWHDGLGLSLYAKRLDRGPLHLAVGGGRRRWRFRRRRWPTCSKASTGEIRSIPGVRRRRDEAATF